MLLDTIAHNKLLFQSVCGLSVVCLTFLRQFGIFNVCWWVHPHLCHRLHTLHNRDVCRAQGETSPPSIHCGELLPPGHRQSIKSLVQEARQKCWSSTCQKRVVHFCSAIDWVHPHLLHHHLLLHSHCQRQGQTAADHSLRRECDWLQSAFPPGPPRLQVPEASSRDRSRLLPPMDTNFLLPLSSSWGCAPPGPAPACYIYIKLTPSDLLICFFRCSSLMLLLCAAFPLTQYIVHSFMIFSRTLCTFSVFVLFSRTCFVRPLVYFSTRYY